MNCAMWPRGARTDVFQFGQGYTCCRPIPGLGRGARFCAKSGILRGEGVGRSDGVCCGTICRAAYRRAASTSHSQPLCSRSLPGADAKR